MPVRRTLTEEQQGHNETNETHLSLHLCHSISGPWQHECHCLVQGPEARTDQPPDELSRARGPLLPMAPPRALAAVALLHRAAAWPPLRPPLRLPRPSAARLHIMHPPPQRPLPLRPLHRHARL